MKIIKRSIILLLIWFLYDLKSFAQTTTETTTYVFDSLNRIKKAIYQNENREYYFYDQLGNRTKKIVTISCDLPTAFLTGSQTIELGQSATLNISFTGTSPYTFQVNGQYFTNINSSTFNFPVTPVTTTNYNISQIQNACGLGTSNGNALVTIIPAIQLPDFIVQSIQVTKYGSNQIEYNVVIKNVGNIPVNLGSFSLAAFGSSDYTKDSNDSFKSAYFLGGGTLNPDQTITYNLNNSINWSGNEHIFIVMADYYSLIQEKSETNNINSSLIKKCTENNQNDIVISGVLTEHFYAAKGKLSLEPNTQVLSNSVLLGGSIDIKPPTPVNQNNVSFVTGTCLDSPGYGSGSSSIQSNNSNSKEKVEPIVEFKFLESTKNSEIKYQTIQKKNFKISVWSHSKKVMIKEITNKQSVESGTHSLNLEGYSLQTGETYIVHFESESGSWAKVINY